MKIYKRVQGQKEQNNKHLSIHHLAGIIENSPFWIPVSMDILKQIPDILTILTYNS